VRLDLLRSAAFNSARSLEVSLTRASAAFLVTLTSGVIGACAGGPPENPADLLLHNGKVVTVDAGGTIAAAAAIRDGRIVYVGTSDEARALAGPDTEQIDLAGRTVIPGLADNHFHSIGGGPGVDLSRARTLNDVLTAIRERAASTPPGGVVVTNSDWHEGQLAEQRLPYRRDLDQAAPDHPVVVVRGGHEYILNSAALARWKITARTGEPEGGSIGRYEDGTLNGELVDRAKYLVTLPPAPAKDAEQAIRDLVDEYRRLNEAGLTGIRYPGTTPEMWATLQEIKRRGLLTMRVNVVFRIAATEDVDQALTRIGVKPDEGDEWVRVGGIKLGVDGGFEGGWMREPYLEPLGRMGTYRGLQTFPSDRYKAAVRTLNQRGWRVATHAVGDAAIDLVLEAYEAAHKESSIADRRWSIEHAFIPRTEHFPRMKALGLVISAQNHLYLAAPSLVKYWGGERASWMTPMRAYIDAGIPVSTGTDAAVVPYPPFWTLYHFITRDTISGGVMGPDQRITREEALGAATMGNAYLRFEEQTAGSIEAGKVADLLVLADDFLTVPEEGIENMRVAMTIVGGRIVHRAP
jgi:predicted amidohydrolase YtcJ